MKAEKIRVEQDKVKTYGRAGNVGKDTVEHMTCWVLHEIAAQLAELNENLYSIVPDGPDGRVLRTESVKDY